LKKLGFETSVSTCGGIIQEAMKWPEDILELDTFPW
jgi:hypothetical protein